MSTSPCCREGVCSSYQLSGLVEQLYPDAKACLEVLRAIPGTAPVEHRYTFARFGGTRTALKPATPTAIRMAMPPDHDGDVALTLILAPTEDVAKLVSEDPDLLYRTVKVDTYGRLLELEWHGQTPSADERSSYQYARRAQREALEKAIALELGVIRRQRLAEAGF